MKNRIIIADAISISGICAIIFPHCLIIGFVASLLFLLVIQKQLVFQKNHLITFVPEPLAPNFKDLSQILRNFISRAAANDGNTSLLLTSIFHSNGSFIPYEVDWNAKDKDIIIRCNGKETHRHCDAPIRIRCALPIRIKDECQILTIKHSSNIHPTAEWVIPLSVYDSPPPPSRVFYHFYMTGWIWLYVFFANPDTFPFFKLFVMAIIPGIVFQSFSFKSRIRRFVSKQINFFVRLRKRFFSHSKDL